MNLDRVRKLLKRHFFWAAVLALVLPLLIILVVQYRSLRAMEQTLPLYRKEAMVQYLKAVTSEVAGLYSSQAERALAVPASAIENRIHGVIQDDAGQMRALAAVARVKDHFKQQAFKGARRFFVAVETESGGINRSAIFFYDPARQAMVLDPQAPELRAINVVAASYMIYVRTRTPVQPQAMGIDRDPNCPLIVKPILDEEQIIVGLAGMTVDQQWFRNEVMPQAINNSLPKFFPSDFKQANVTLRYFNDEVIYATQPGGNQPPEASVPVAPFFWNYLLGMRLGHLSVEQLARQNFMLNLSLSVLMTLLLVGGLIMVLRTTAREMKLSQMKTDFVANVSHELRTPLTSICAFGELLKLGRINQPEKVREFGGYIELQGRRLTQLINNILDFSRIESGQKRYQFALADLREVVAEAVGACAVRLKQSGHILEIEAPEQALPPVFIDYDAMVVALSNLLDNAIKYSGEAKEILVRLAREEGFATLAVKDRGIGIAHGEHERIFEKFYRVSTGMVHDVKGAGLGLSIVKHIVEAHQGRITIESEPELGSTFTIHLPVADIDQNLSAPQPLKTDREGGIYAKSIDY